MSKVQITPTRTNAVNPMRIHCSTVRCFKLIPVLAGGQAHPGQYIAVHLSRYQRGDHRNDHHGYVGTYFLAFAVND